MKPFFVYLLRCADGSFYVGHTDELERRVAQHQSGELPGWTHDRRPVALAWSQQTATRDEALAAEMRIKGWSRAKKEALIAGDWDEVRRLAKGRERDEAAVPSELGLRQAQPERGTPSPARPEPVEGPGGGPGLRQPQPERGAPPSARPEPAEGPGGRPGLRRAQPERGAPPPTRPEPVEGSGPAPAPLPATDQALLDAITGPPGPAQRRAVAKAITLLESTRADHRARADGVLNALLPHTGRAFRLGLSGVPGVGKSTFIEALGLFLLGRGHRVAVLAVDPSSSVSGGSILGDKTRMERLSADERAYIRPSPAAGNLGGVAEKTRESLLVCEAAGFNVVIVETVGVGQSETAVAGMTDCFVLLQLPNAGDDLQAIKKGVMELADLVVINKADLDAAAATRAQAQITSALRLLGLHGRADRAHHDTGIWHPEVMQLSALKGTGVAGFWAVVERYRALQTANGQLAGRRRRQATAWLWERIEAGLRQRFRGHPRVREALPGMSREVEAGTLAPSVAARRLLDLMD